MRKTAVAIPAYKPGAPLVAVVQELKKSGFDNIIVVDDGSGPDHAHIFAEVKRAGALVLTHAINMGKGRALKTAFNHYLGNYEDTVGIITADADGQHKVPDVIRVAEALEENPDRLIIGARKFTGDVPFRSRFGNGMTRVVYAITSGNRVSDTQTGLRGFPRSRVADMLRLPGERYEYEMAMLMELKNLNLQPCEVEIETVYENNNEASHFNPLRDSWLIYKTIFCFVGSSLASFAVDYVLFAMFTLNGWDMLSALLCARAVSSLVNFFLNRKVMLSKVAHGKAWVHLIKYYLLVVVAFGLNYLLLELFTGIGIGVYFAQIIASLIVYVFNFIVQKRLIFK